VGEVSITPTDIEIFPVSYHYLAIGVTFTAKLPGRLFDAKGTVWRPQGRLSRKAGATSGLTTSRSRDRSIIRSGP
jgi:hypothetical protein